MRCFFPFASFSSMGHFSSAHRLTQPPRLLRQALLGALGMTLLAALPVRAELTAERTSELTLEAASQLPKESSQVESAKVEVDQAEAGPVEAGQVGAGEIEAGRGELGIERQSPTVSSPGDAAIEQTGLERTSIEAGVGVAPLPLALPDLGPPPEAPLMLDQVPLEAKSRVANRRLVIRLAQRRVYVYEGKTLFVSYPIAVGREGWETPKGEFKIFQMIQDPSWQHPWNGSIVPPGPDNPLGRRWIGFWTDGVNSIGFHGTPNESLVGQAVSHGCIRMKNADVQNLFAMVGDGTTVVVE
jgi:L,D-transpeptidase ErfK/SrfK